MKLLNYEKLAKICAMFGSSFPNERAVAAELANQMVRDAGRTWNDVFSAPVKFVVVSEALDWREMRRTCLENDGLVTAWERNFLHSIGSRTELSDKQMEVLERIYAKVTDE